MKNQWQQIAFIVLLISEGLVLYFNNNLSKEILIKNKYVDYISERRNAAETQISMGVENSGLQIDSKLNAKDTSDANIPLIKIANQASGNILLVRFSDYMCHECVEHTISIFTENKDSFDTNKIIFLAENMNRRTLKLNIAEYGLQDCFVLHCEKLGIPADNKDFPYIMVIDSSLRVLSVYFPNKSTRGTDYDYKHVKYMYDKLIKGN